MSEQIEDFKRVITLRRRSVGATTLTACVFTKGNTIFSINTILTRLNGVRCIGDTPSAMI